MPGIDHWRTGVLQVGDLAGHGKEIVDDGRGGDPPVDV